MTDAERVLWTHLRARQLQGMKFRRQMWLCGYIADFACPEARLIVEADGGQHVVQSAYDADRTDAFAREGYRVLRFWNHDILSNPDGVLETISAALPSPSQVAWAPPSPRSGRGDLNPRPGFTGAGIDRADHLRLDEARLAALAADAAARLLPLAALDPVIDEDGRLAWAMLSELAEEVELIFLGFAGETPLFAPLVPVEPGQRAWSVFGILSRMAPEDAAIWGAARSLLEWHSRHGFCGRCGARTASFRGGWGRRCTGCGLDHFPRVDPVVIMLAEHGGRILLGRQPQYPPGRYSALAGFVEPGESIEEAVTREISEEAGIEVTNVRYVASQPWPFPGQLMIACIADAASDALILDRNELEDAIWVDRAGVAAALAGEAGAPFQAPPPFAIANTLLLHWADGLARSPAPA